MWSMTGCQTNEVRGVFAGKFEDGSATFVKRIAISSLDGPELSLALVSRSKQCELISPLPTVPLTAENDCRGINGSALLRCQDASEIPLRWQMTSCHSGYGRSVSGMGPGFLFGFSGNLYNAQTQMEHAADAPSVFPDTACQSASEKNPLVYCAPPLAEPNSPMPTQP